MVCDLLFGFYLGRIFWIRVLLIKTLDEDKVRVFGSQPPQAATGSLIL